MYLDCGNTRVKYQVGEGAVVALDYDAFSVGLPALVAANRVGNVVMASVHGSERRKGFIDSLKNAVHGPVRRCVVTEEALGVRCGYSDVARLGIDRWLGVVAVWAKWHQAALVVDLGTATTLDFLAPNGRHLGGFIVSGLELSVRGLLAGTDNIRPDFGGFGEANLNPGCSTADAIYNGALQSAVALIESSYQNLLKTSPEAKLILAGGDSRLVGSHLTSTYHHLGELVFEGMRLLEQAALLIDA